MILSSLDEGYLKRYEHVKLYMYIENMNIYAQICMNI